jgi:hypothetical protein
MHVVPAVLGADMEDFDINEKNEIPHSCPVVGCDVSDTRTIFFFSEKAKGAKTLTTAVEIMIKSIKFLLKFIVDYNIHNKRTQ